MDGALSTTELKSLLRGTSICDGTEDHAVWITPDATFRVQNILKGKGLDVRCVHTSFLQYAHRYNCECTGAYDRSVGILAHRFKVAESAAPTLIRSLLPFQIDAVCYAIRRYGRILLADDMGTGKTRQSLAIAAAYYDLWPLLVVCPASLRSYWIGQIEEWFPHLRPDELHCIYDSSDAIPLPTGKSDNRPRVTVISYHMLQRLRKTVGTMKWSVVIFDEAHTLRTASSLHSHRSKEADVADGVIRRSVVCVLCSGTPLVKSPIDVFDILDEVTCRPRKLSLKESFQWRQTSEPSDRDLATLPSAACSCSSNRAQRIVNYAGYTSRVFFNHGRATAGGEAYEEQELHDVLTALLMIRRTKEQVLSHLPGLSRTVIRIAGSAPAQTGEDETLDSWTLFRQAGVSKACAVAEWVSDQLVSRWQKPSVKVVIFAHHVEVMDMLFSALSKRCSASGDAKRKWMGSLVRLDGKCSPQEKDEAVRKLETDQSIKVGLVSIKAGGQGLNLYCASIAVFVEWGGPLNAADVKQAEDRLHRMGQRRSVQVFYACREPGCWEDGQWGPLKHQLMRSSRIANGVQNQVTLVADRVMGMQSQTVLPSQFEDTSCEGPQDHSPPVPNTGPVTVSARMSGTVAPPACFPYDCANDYVNLRIQDDVVETSSTAKWDEVYRACCTAFSEWAFWVSANTGRIHIFRQCIGDAGEPGWEHAGASVNVGDVSLHAAAREQRDILPEYCSEALCLLRRFVREYSQMSQRQRAILLGFPARVPLLGSNGMCCQLCKPAFE